MGRFKDAVSENKFPNPFSRSFDPTVWKSQHVDDASDLQLKGAGLAVYELVSILRSQSKIGQPNRERTEALVAHANQHICQAHERLRLIFQTDESASINLETVLNTKLSDAETTLGELTDAIGDTYVYPLREAVCFEKAEVRTNTVGGSSNALSEALFETYIANKWFIAWMIWMEALWTDGVLETSAKWKWKLYHRDSRREAIRQIGAWRRMFHEESTANAIAFLRPRTTFGSGTLLPSFSKVGKKFLIQLKQRKPRQQSWAENITPRVLLSELVLSEDVGKLKLSLYGVELNVLEAIVFYSTLISMFFELFKKIPIRKDGATQISDAVELSVANLQFTISELTSISTEKTKALIEYATFRGSHKQSLWGRPFVYAGKDSRFVFMPALKSSITRVVNDLIDAHSSNHSAKGIVFEVRARQQLSRDISEGPLSAITWIAPRSIVTTVGEIDLCILVETTLLVIEAKYVGSAIDAYEYARADSILKEAVAQIERNTDLIRSDLISFSNLLKKSYGAPERSRVSKVIPIVLTNDTYHAGFPFAGVPVVDLPIMEVFFRNKFVDVQVLSGEKLVESASKIYGTDFDALSVLEKYLYEPEIIVRANRRLRSRSVEYRTGVGDGLSEIVVERSSFEVRA
jgi:hypothetical protein